MFDIVKLKWIPLAGAFICNLLDIFNLESETLIQIKIEFLMHSNWPTFPQKIVA